MSIFWTISVIAVFSGFTAVPLLILDGGREYISFLWHYAGALSILGATWAALGSWLLRRVAEFALLRRSGAKLNMDA
jgi:hypothetical protein